MDQPADEGEESPPAPNIGTSTLGLERNLEVRKLGI